MYPVSNTMHCIFIVTSVSRSWWIICTWKWRKHLLLKKYLFGKLPFVLCRCADLASCTEERNVITSSGQSPTNNADVDWCNLHCKYLFLNIIPISHWVCEKTRPFLRCVTFFTEETNVWMGIYVYLFSPSGNFFYTAVMREAYFCLLRLFYQWKT
jgi:hypothetical protein